MNTKTIFVSSLFFLVFKFIFLEKTYSQRIAIRPQLGFGKVKNSIIQKSNEESFHSPSKNFNFVGSVAIEYFINEKTSIETELHNGIIGYSYRVSKTGNSCLIVYNHFEGFDVMQLNLGINKSLNSFPLIKLLKKQFSGRIKVFLGTGANRLRRTNGELNESQYFYKSVCPDGNDSLKATTRLITKTSGLGGYLCFKTGIRILNQNKKELFDISLFCNFGLTKQYEADVDYYLNNSFYTSKLAAKGTQWGFKLGIPITIWKK